MKLAVLPLVVLVVGCANTSPAQIKQNIQLARTTHTALMDSATDLINAGLIKDQKTKDIIWAVSEEVTGAINDAEVYLGKGKLMESAYAIKRVTSTVTRFAVLITQWRHTWSSSSQPSRPSSERLKPSINDLLEFEIKWFLDRNLLPMTSNS